jgi:hypothetical protein
VGIAACAASAAALACTLAGCGSARTPSAPAAIPPGLLAQARPIGRGARFHPPATGRVGAPCSVALGPRSAVHIELFAANRVVIVPAGIGTRPPRTVTASRVSGARCYGPIVTLEPTGVVLVRPGIRATLSALFQAWGQPLSRLRFASFRANPGQQVAVFIGGRRWRGPPGAVALAQHAEIVLEVGPHVPPHTHFTFPSGL